MKEKDLTENDFTLPEGLTPKQSLFVMDYIQHFNATKAAKSAGYSEHTAKDIGCENLAKPNIKEAIAEELSYRAQASRLSSQYIVKSLMQNAKRCSQGEQVMVSDGEGNLVPSGEWKFDSSGMNKALDLLGKHLGMYTDKVEHSSDGLSFNMNFGEKEDKE